MEWLLKKVCVIGSNTAVTKSIEPYSIVVENPARIIGKNKVNIRRRIK